MRALPIFSLTRPIAAVLVAVGVCFAAPAPKPAAAPPSRAAAPASTYPQALSIGPAASSLDTAQVRKLYMESDFEEAIALLEGALKAKHPLSHADSVYIYKYLGVMYTSKYESRELGKRHFYQLLEIDASARINDMFASDMIYMIFKNVQDEYFATHPHAKSPSHGPKEPKRSSGHAAWYWAGGAGLALAAGVTAYILMDRPAGKSVDHPIPP